ncbi:MAG: hypothetical protein EOP47_11985 [Sphingobacteriaceae bacterium]|nr:MAG: hypothetical protein EOP47_11985 [Sphingobacteriaceae bacterium]
MKKISQKILLLLTAAITIAGCKKDFQDRYVNPNKPTAVQPSLLLTGIMNKMLEAPAGQNDRTNQYQLQNNSYFGNNQYNFGSGTNYYATLTDVQNMEILSATAGEVNPYGAMGKFFRAYFFTKMSLQMGDIPMSQALQGAKLLTPVYDAQKTIFINSLDLLEQANADLTELISKGNATISGDIYFNNNLKVNYLPGDIIHVPHVPTIQKSRPIACDNANAVLLNLDKHRHFVFVHDKTPFAAKKDMLVGRGTVTQPHRIKFMELHFNNPLCDVGQVNKKGGNANWLKPKLSITGHLLYKFILSLEGNDVATNLKWIMSSNSVAVMPRPKYETWFMEGKLIPDFHYIMIKDDFSDLDEKISYYLAHTDKAQQIAKNANKYVAQFFDKDKEDIIALLVLQKYFKYTSQLNENAE